jgi:AraC family transcriptional regulator
MLRAIATLSTPTTHIEVSEGLWTEPMEYVTNLDRPAMSLLIGLESGGEATFIDGPVRTCGRVGRVVFTPPDREVVAQSAPGKMRVVSCSFDRNHSERIFGSFDKLSRSQLLSCLDVHSTLLPVMLSRLMAETLHPGFVSAAVADSFAEAMLAEWSHTVLSREPTTRQRARLLPRHFKAIEEYLAGLSGETPNVSAVAAACGFSDRYFSKLFREQTNQSIGQYLRSAQIAKAQAYLLQTDLPLKEIAHRLGFKTPANFSDAFRAATGDTPGRFRSSNRVRRGRSTVQ